MEMGAEQIYKRFSADISDISFSHINKGSYNSDEDYEKVLTTIQELHALPIHIDDTPALTIAQLRRRALTMRRKHGLGLLVVDYIQLMRPVRSRPSRVHEIEEITTGLKALAKEMGIPIIALSQLSRKVDERENKRPVLSDLRDSGSIEQDADIVIFMFREFYYIENAEPKQRDGEKGEVFQERHERWQQRKEACENQCELIVAKQRNGITKAMTVFFEGRYQRFGNISRTEEGDYGR